MPRDVTIRLLQCPRQDSNLRTRFRKPLLYPLSYGSITCFRSSFRLQCFSHHDLSTTILKNGTVGDIHHHYSNTRTGVLGDKTMNSKALAERCPENREWPPHRNGELREPSNEKSAEFSLRFR
jgi:hypothetical protein